MKIKDLAEFSQLLKICRNNGVQTFEIDGVKVTLQPKVQIKRQRPVLGNSGFVEENIPVPQYQGQPIPEETPTEAIKTPDELTQEQLLFYSSAPTEAIVEAQ